MKRIPKLMLVFGLLGATATAAALMLSRPWDLMTCGLLLVLMVWWAVRERHFRQWSVTIGEEGIRVTMPGPPSVDVEIDYQSVCRVQWWPPSFRHFIYARQKKRKIIDDQLWRPAAIAGIDKTSTKRRLCFGCSDLLVQAIDGRTALIPGPSLSMRAVRRLWSQLYDVDHGAPPDVRARSFRPLPEDVTRAIELENAAGEADSSRQWLRAISGFENAASAWRSAGIAESIGRCSERRVKALIALGRFEDARLASLENLSLQRRLGNDFSQASALNDLSAIAYASGNPSALKEAITCLEQAEELYNKSGESFVACRMRANQALVLDALYRLTGDGDHLPKLKRLTDESRAKLRLTDVRPTEPIYQYQESRLLGLLGGYYYYLEDWAKSVDYYERAFALLGPRAPIAVDLGLCGRAAVAWGESLHGHGPRNAKRISNGLQQISRAVESARTAGHLPEELEVVVLRADAFWHLGNTEAAVRDYESALKMLQELRLLSITSAEDIAGLLRRYRHIVRKVTEGLLRLGSNASEERRAMINRAFQYGDAAKAQHLAHQLNLYDKAARALPRRLQEELRRASLSLRMVYYHKGLMDSIDGEGVLGSSGLTREAFDRFEAVKARIANEHPGFFEQVAMAPPALDEVQRGLPENAAVLAFVVGESALCVFLVTRNKAPAKTCFYIENLGREALKEQFLDHGFLAAYREYAGKRNPANALEIDDAWSEKLPEHIDQTRRVIFSARGSNGQSIQNLIDECGITQLTIIPDLMLARMFCHVAVERVEQTAYCPSVSIMRQIARNPEHTPARPLVVIGPASSGDSEPAFNYEGQSVARRLRERNLPVDTLENRRATLEAVLEGMKRSDLIHFCAHGVVNFEAPLKSHLTLDDGNTYDGSAGHLTVERLFEHGEVSRGATVVMNACESGVLPDDLDAEALGLPTAFLIAGASCVVSTLCQVPLSQPVEIMNAYYDRLVGGDSTPAALQAALGITGRSPSVIPSGPSRGIGKNVSGVDTPHMDLYHWAPFITWGLAWRPGLQQGEFEESSWALQPSDSPRIGISPDVVELLNKAKVLIDSERWEDAYPMLEQAGRAAEIPGILADWAMCCSRTGRVEQALYLYRRVLTMDLNSFFYHYNLGCAYRDHGNFLDGRRCFEDALKLDPYHVDAIGILADMTIDNDEALKLAKRALEIDPDHPTLKALVEQRQQIRNLSVRQFAELRLDWSSQAIRSGRYHGARVEAFAAMQTALDSAQHARACQLAGDTYRFEAGSPPSEPLLNLSIHWMKRAVNLDPNMATRWNDLGARRLLLAQQLGKTDTLEEAEKDCRRALQIAGYARPHHNLGAIYHQLGRLDDARAECDISLQIAREQCNRGPQGILLCKGCPTQGQLPEACSKCVDMAKDLKRNLELTSGAYVLVE